MNPRPTKKLAFPKQIKKYILDVIRKVVLEADTEEKVERLLKNKLSFIDFEENKKFAEKVLRFINKKEILSIANKNISFCYPKEFPQSDGVIRYSFSFGGKGAQLMEIIDDFILYTSRLLSGEENIDDRLEEEWKKFESDFFSDEIELIFTAPLAKFFYHGGGIIEELIPREEIVIRYLHPDNKEERAYIYNLKKSFEDSFRPVCKDEFPACPIIAEYKTKGSKSKRIADYFKEASDIFEKIVFILRLVCDGSAHFGLVKSYFLGNLANTNLAQSYPINHLYAKNFESTILGSGPYDTWVKRAWEGINSRDISEWQFANQKLRDSYSRASAEDDHYFFDPSYRMSRQLERLVDLIQAIEFTIGDYGYYIGEYVGKLVSRGNEEKEKKIQTEVQALYILRGKYLHGKPRGRDSVESTFRSKFQGKIELLEEAINHLEYYLRQILLVSVLNPNLKEKIYEYHESLGRPIVEVKRKSASPIDFPEFETIYY